MLPNGVNGGSSHVVVVGALGVGGEDQQMAAVHALQEELGFVCTQGIFELGLIYGESAAQLISAPLLADAEPDPLVLPNGHFVK